MDTGVLKRASLIFPATTAAGYVLVATYPHGAGITSDSIHYLTAARHLIDGGTLTTYTGEPLVSYAPLLSVVYALLGLTGIGLQLGARLVSAFSFAAVVWVTWHWLGEMQAGSRVVWVATILVLFARPLMWYAPYALSELPFVALTMCALWQAWHYVKEGGQIHLVASGVCTGLSALMRWIGVTTAGTIAIFILLACHRSCKKRFALAAGYVLVTLMPFVLWISRNRLLTGTFFGVREPSDYPLRQMVFDTLWSLHRWMIPVTFENSVPLFGVLAALCILLLVAALRLQWRHGDTDWKRGVLLLFLYIGLYAFALVIMTRGAKFEALSERLWSPIAVPLVLCLVLMWTLLQSSSYLMRLARGALILVGIGWCLSGSAFGVEMLGKCFRDGPGVFNTSAWRDSDTLHWLRGHPLKGRVYTNFPEPLYYFTGIVSEHTPHKGPMRVASETHPRNLQQFLQELQDDWKRGHQVYIVWLHDQSRSEYLYSLYELKERLSLRPVKKSSDGAVFEVYPHTTSGSGGQ